MRILQNSQEFMTVCPKVQKVKMRFKERLSEFKIVFFLSLLRVLCSFFRAGQTS